MSVIFRVEKAEFIKKWIKHFSDDDIDEIFQIFDLDVDLDYKCEKKRQSKFNQIIDKLHLISDENFKKIYQIVIEKLELHHIKIDDSDARNNKDCTDVKKSEEIKNDKNNAIIVKELKDGERENFNIDEVTVKKLELLQKKESQHDKMKRVMLEIVNKILIKMNRDAIHDLCDFVDVQRDELIKDEYAEIIDNCKEYIFLNGFDKHRCQLHQAKVTYVHISIFKGMLKQIGYSLFSKNHKKMVNKVCESYTTYSIKEK